MESRLNLPCFARVRGTYHWGYPRADMVVFGPPNAEFPILDRDWGNTVEPCLTGQEFPQTAHGEFSLDSVRETAKKGDQLIKAHKELHLALRSLQGRKMRQQTELAHNAKIYLKMHLNCARTSPNYTT